MIFHQPLYSNLSDRMNQTGDTETLLLVEPELFSELVLPNGMESDEVVNCILTVHGRAPLDHFDPKYMRRAIGVWSHRRLPIWEKLLKTTHFDYDPISNYDRKEEYTDTRTHEDSKDNTVTTKFNSTINNTNTVSGTSGMSQTAENQVSADNISGYSPESKRTTSGSENSNSTTIDDGTNTGLEDRHEVNSSNYSDTATHIAHLYGNIGVTTTQQMIGEERQIVNYSVAEVIANDYRDRFCIDFY